MTYFGHIMLQPNLLKKGLKLPKVEGTTTSSKVDEFSCKGDE